MDSSTGSHAKAGALSHVGIVLTLFRNNFLPMARSQDNSTVTKRGLSMVATDRTLNDIGLRAIVGYRSTSTQV
jgi:hypothetical protein